MANRGPVTARGGQGQRRARGVASHVARSVAVLVLLAMVGISPRTLAASALDIAATVGFSDTFRPGHWTPLTVTVANRGDDLNGELEVQVSGDDALRGRVVVASYRRTLELNRNSRKSIQLIVYPQGLSHSIVIRVSSGGRELARNEVDLRTRFAAQRLILVLSRDADLDYLNDGAVDGLRVLHPHPELLPVHWRGYDAVAAIVLHGMSLERLTESQFDALRKWIAQGGTLAVSGGVDYALLRTPRLAGLLPGVPQGVTSIDVDVLQRALAPSLRTSRPVHVNRLGPIQGEVRLRAGDVPLLVERGLGLGRVVYLTFDVASAPFDRWEGMRSLLLDNLRLPPVASAASRAPEPGSETALKALIRAASPDFPATWLMFLLVALYLGVLLAVHTMPAHRAGKQWLAPLWAWGVPILFAVGSWLLFGPRAFPRGATAAAVALIEPLPHTPYARLALELGLYANERGALRFEYRGADPVLQPHRQARREGKVQDWVFGDGPGHYVAPLDPRRYVLHALEGEDVIAFRVEAAVQAEGTGVHLRLDNASGRSLQDLWLVFDGYAYALGSVAADARIERQLVASVDGVEIRSTSWLDLVTAPGGIRSAVQAPTRILLQRRVQEAGSSGLPGSGHALLVAHTSSPVRPARASAGWSHLAQALVAFQVAANAGDARARDAKPAEGSAEAVESPEPSALRGSTSDRRPAP